jgi:hypothetical protein
VSEGFLHGALVARLAEHMRLEFGEDIDLLLVDLPGARPSEKPPRIGRFTPDVWAQSKRRILLGEAKTAIDLDKPHTRSQIESFLEHVRSSPRGSRLVLAVPGFVAPHAKILLAEIALSLQIDSSLWSVLGAEAFG